MPHDGSPLELRYRSGVHNADKHLCVVKTLFHPLRHPRFDGLRGILLHNRRAHFLF
jgi:hypothetical protein